MSARISNGDSSDGSADSLPGHAYAADPGGADHSLLAEDPLTGLAWTETLLPLVTNWAGTSAVHVVCLHFVGLGILASLPEYQSSHSLLREATERLVPLMGDEDRLTRFSGNKLLVFSKRPEATVRRLMVDISDRLETFGTEVEGRHLPEVRVGMAMLGGHGQGTVTPDAMNTLMSDAAEATIPIAEIVAPREQRPEPEVALPAAVPLPAAQDLPRQITQTNEETETPMIIRGHPERTPIRPVDSPEPAVPSRRPASDHRLILKAVDVVVTGLVATAVVDLDFEGRRVRGKAIGRSAESHHIELVGEAMTRAVTDLLPAGHGVVFRQAVSTSTDAGDVVVTVVEFLTPDRNEFLFGIAPAEGEPIAGLARSVLNAVNHPTALLLEAAG